MASTKRQCERCFNVSYSPAVTKCPLCGARVLPVMERKE